MFCCCCCSSFSVVVLVVVVVSCQSSYIRSCPLQARRPTWPLHGQGKPSLWLIVFHASISQSYRLGLAVHSARTSLKRGDGHSAFLATTAFACARAEKLSTFSGSPRKRVRTTGLQRLLLATNSAIGALRDPKRADLVATLGETTGRLQLQNIHEKMADNESGSRILSERPRVNQRTIDIESLLQLDSNTFGHAYGKFLDNHGFDPDDRPPVKVH